jgi:hypothetical protein
MRITEFENMSPFVTGNVVYISVSWMANRKLFSKWESSVAPNHTPRSTTIGRTPLDEGSAGRRGLYFYEQRSQETEIHDPPHTGIRTRNLSKGAAA